MRMAGFAIAAGAILLPVPGAAAVTPADRSGCRQLEDLSVPDDLVPACTRIIEAVGSVSRDDRALAFRHRANAHSARGDWRRAYEDYGEAIRLDPRDGYAYLGRGRAAARRRDFAAAGRDFEEALRLLPRNVSARAQRGLIRQELADLAGALADFDRAIALEPNGADLYFLRGQVHSAGGDWQRAVDDYSEAIRLGFDAYLRRGRALNELGDFARAMGDLSLAISQRPGDGDGYVERGLARYRQGDFDGAIADFGEAIALAPGDAFLYGSRGAVNAQAGYRAAAIADARRSRERAPEDPSVLGGFCWILAVANGDAEEARGACDAALGMHESDDVLASRALLGVRQRRFRDALNDYDAALRMSPDWPPYLYGRGLAAVGLGRTAEGDADMARAVQLDPEIEMTFAGYGFTR